MQINHDYQQTALHPGFRKIS